MRWALCLFAMLTYWEAGVGLFTPAGVNYPPCGGNLTGERRPWLLTSVNYTRGETRSGVTDGNENGGGGSVTQGQNLT